MNRQAANFISRLQNAKRSGITARLASAFLGIASLTLLASVVAFFSYNYIERNLQHIEADGIPAMSRALIFARQTAEYSMIVTELRAADDRKALLAAVKRLKAKYEEMSATLEALPDLRTITDSFKASTDAVASAIDRRLADSAQRKALVERAIAAHQRIFEKIIPVLDDARFALALGLEALERHTMPATSEAVRNTQSTMSVLRGLSDIRAETHVALGILMEVGLAPRVELLTPLRDRMTATISRARKVLSSLENATEERDIRPAVEALLAFGGGASDLFQARRTELDAIEESWKLVSASQAQAAMLTAQVQDSVRTGANATAAAVDAAQSAITQSRVLLIALAVLSLGCAILFAWIYVGRGLLVRLGRLNDAILALAGGNLDVEIPSEGHDELARVAAAVEVFKQNAIEARDLEADKERGRIADLRQREASFRLLFQGNPVPMWVVDRKSLRFLSVNDAAVAIYGYSHEQFLSMTMRDILRNEASSVITHFLDQLAGNSLGEQAWQHLRADGKLLDVITYGRALTYHGTEAALAATIDITERKRAEARVIHMAHHDGLTDLPNRALFRERLDEALKRERRSKTHVAVLALDLDRFKEVNDTLGHHIGDALLKGVSHRLQSCVRETDTVARLGGDEFAVVQDLVDEPLEAATLAQRIRGAIVEPYELSGHHVLVGTSIGIAVSPADGDDADQLLKHADLALYRAKSEGGNSYHFFEPEMDQRMLERRSLEHDLRNALISGEFALHYQPLINVEQGRICGFEALLRWTHPKRGKVPPDAFIPLAEETGLIVPIGEWVIRQACKDAANWPSRLKIAVNVSVAQFKSRKLVALIAEALAASGMAPERLELEITETVMSQDEHGAFEILKRLHALGVRIALDDFGTGYSSLANLRRFPFDKIKIDRSFVSDLSAANINALAVVRSIAQLGTSLGMVTTAEGIETTEQMDRVRAEGCTEMQGFLFSGAVAAGEIPRLLLAEEEKRTHAA